MADEVCETCGERNRNDAEFCVFCGSYLGWQDRQQPDEPPRDPISAEPPPAAETAILPALGSSTTEHQSPASPPGGRTQHTPPVPGISGVPCPICGTLNELGLRFCRKCGHSLISAPPASAVRPAARRGWWARLWHGAGNDRAAQLAYRKSLPLRYRVRRVVLSVVAVCLGAALVAFLVGNPVGRVRGLIDQVRNTVYPVEITTTAVLPQDAAVRGAAASGVSDQDPLTAWATHWRFSQTTGSCRKGQAGGQLVLNLTAAVHIRKVTIGAGLPADQSERAGQSLPCALDFAYDNGEHQRIVLNNLAPPQSYPLDSKTNVRTVTISVITAYPPPQQEGARKLVSIRTIQVFSRPAPPSG